MSKLDDWMKEREEGQPKLKPRKPSVDSGISDLPDFSSYKEPITINKQAGPAEANRILPTKEEAKFALKQLDVAMGDEGISPKSDLIPTVTGQYSLFTSMMKTTPTVLLDWMETDRGGEGHMLSLPGAQRILDAATTITGKDIDTGPSVIAQMTKEYLDKHPEKRAAVDANRSGLWEIDASLTEEEKRVFHEYQEADWYTGSGISLINMAKQAVAQTYNYALSWNLPVLNNMMKSEAAHNMKRRFESRGFEFDPDLYQTELNQAADVSTVIEFSGDSLSIANMIGKKALGKIFGKELAEKFAKTGPAGRVLLGGHAEGSEEVGQGLVYDFFANRALAKEAIRQGKPVAPITFKEMVEDAPKAYRSGFAPGAVMGGIGAIRDSETTSYGKLLPDDEVDVILNLQTELPGYRPIAQLNAPQQDQVVLAFAQKTEEVVSSAIDKGDGLFREHLEKATDTDLRTLARALSIPIEVGNREALIESIFESRLQLPRYNETVLEHVIAGAKEATSSPATQHMIKWSAQGDFNTRQFPLMRMIMENWVENSTYPGTLDDLMREEMVLQGAEDTLLDYDQVTSWLIWGHNAFDVERAHHMLQVQGKEPQQMPVEEIRQYRLPLMYVDKDRAMTDEVDPQKYPIILGTTKHGTLFVMDGYHRVEKAIQSGMETMPVQILDLEQTRMMAEPGSKLVFDQRDIRPQSGWEGAVSRWVKGYGGSDSDISRHINESIGHIYAGDIPALRKEIPNPTPELRDMITQLEEEQKRPPEERQMTLDFLQAEGYHGGGRFSHFDVSYIGTGEGAQAFGWGFYFTERFGIAKDYARSYRRKTGTKLIQNNEQVQPDMFGTTPEVETYFKGTMNETFKIISESGWKSTLSVAESNRFDSDKRLMSDLNGDADKLIKSVLSDVFDMNQLSEYLTDMADQAAKDDMGNYYIATILHARDIVREMKGQGVSIKKGPDSHIYKVTLFPGKEAHEYTLLSWYDPVPQEILDRLPHRIIAKGQDETGFPIAKKFATKEEAQVYADTIQGGRVIIGDIEVGGLTIPKILTDTGELLYETIADNLGSQEKASKFLESMGIEGIIYPAESLSGGRTELEPGHNNYVIFNEKNVRIDDAKAYQRDLDLFQKGRPMPSGGYVVRGRTSILPTGFMMLNLFLTGDFNTLRHEWAHIMFQWLSDEQRDALITDVMKKYHRNIPNRGRYKQEINHYKNVYEQYKADRTWGIGLPVQQHKRLVRLQEFLAESFEAYMYKHDAPNQKLEPAFREARQVLANYYSGIRKKLKPKYQMLSPELAAVFDELLAGDEVYPPNSSMVVRLADDNGVFREYTLNKSRPQILVHKILLQSLERGMAEYSGLHERLAQYTKMMLGKADTDHLNAIALVKNRKQGIAYLKRVDVEVARQQEAEHKGLEEDVRAAVKKLRGRKSRVNGVKIKLQPQVEKLLDTTLEYIDIARRSAKREKRMEELARAMFSLRKGLVDEMKGIPEELRAVTDSELKDLFDWRKRKLSSLTKDELITLLDVIRDLGKYNKFLLQQEIDAVFKRESALNKQLNMQIEGNWRYQRGYKREGAKLTVGQERLLTKFHKAFSLELDSPLIDLLMFSEGVDGSVLEKLVNDLVDGRVKQLEITKEWYKVTRNIREGLPEHGISRSLGNVKSSDIVKHKMYERGRNDVEVEFTQAQLMLLYGWSKNPKGFKKLMTGVIQKDQKHRVFEFKNEESLYTLLSQLTPELRAIVDFMIIFYETRVYPQANTVYRDLTYGVELDREENYLPLSVATSGVYNTGYLSLSKLHPHGRDFARNYVLNSDFLYARTDAKTPVYAEDFFEWIGQSLNDIAFYIGMASPIAQARIQLFGSEGDPTGTTAKLTTALGKHKVAQIKTWLERIEDPNGTRETEFLTTLVKLNAKTRSAYLNLSLSVLFIQPITTRLYKTFGLSELSLAESAAKHVAHGMMPLHPIAELMELNPLLWERYERIPAVYMEREGVNHRARRVWVAPTSLVTKIYHARTAQDVKDILTRSDDSTLQSLMFFDSIALSIGLEGFLVEGRKKGWSYETSVKKFLEATTQSQPMNDPLFTSTYLSSTNILFRATFGVYQSARDGIRRVLQRTREQIRNRMHGQKGSVGLGRLLLNFIEAKVIINILTAFVQTMFRRRGKEEKDEEETFREKVANNFFFDWFVQSVTNIISLRPITGTLGAGIINRWVRGWDVSSEELPLLSAAETVGEDTIRLLDELLKDDGDYAKDYGPLISKATKVVADLTVFKGSAYYNIDRQIRKEIKEATKDKDTL